MQTDPCRLVRQVNEFVSYEAPFQEKLRLDGAKKVCRPSSHPLAAGICGSPSVAAEPWLLPRKVAGGQEGVAMPSVAAEPWLLPRKVAGGQEGVAMPSVAAEPWLLPRKVAGGQDSCMSPPTLPLLTQKRSW